MIFNFKVFQHIAMVVSVTLLGFICSQGDFVAAAVGLIVVMETLDIKLMILAFWKESQEKGQKEVEEKKEDKGSPPTG